MDKQREKRQAINNTRDVRISSQRHGACELKLRENSLRQQIEHGGLNWFLRILKGPITGEVSNNLKEEFYFIYIYIVIYTKRSLSVSIRDI